MFSSRRQRGRFIDDLRCYWFLGYGCNDRILLFFRKGSFAFWRRSVILHLPLSMATPSIPRYRCVPVLCLLARPAASTRHKRANQNTFDFYKEKSLRPLPHTWPPCLETFVISPHLGRWLAHTTRRPRCRVRGMAMSASLSYHGILALELVLAWVSFSPIFPLLAA